MTTPVFPSGLRPSNFFGMLELLRRSRGLALAMVLLAPGTAGTAVQWLHSCPTETQAPSKDHQHHSSPASQPGPSHGCDCIGSCSAAAVTVPPTATVVAAVVVPPKHGAVALHAASFVPAGIPAHLLPPATAPPLS